MDDTQVKRKRVQLSVDEKLRRKEQALENAKKDLQEFKRKISAKARKERTHYIIEIGAFVLSKTEKAGISGKEETLKKLEELLAPLSQA